MRWFSSLEDKKNLRFHKAIQFARSYTSITNHEGKILFHSRLNVLMDPDGNIWEKKANPDFDISMGSADGVKVREQVGIYMISRHMS